MDSGPPDGAMDERQTMRSTTWRRSGTTGGRTHTLGSCPQSWPGIGRSKASGTG